MQWCSDRSRAAVDKNGQRNETWTTQIQQKADLTEMDRTDKIETWDRYKCTNQINRHVLLTKLTSQQCSSSKQTKNYFRRLSRFVQQDILEFGWIWRGVRRIWEDISKFIYCNFRAWLVNEEIVTDSCKDFKKGQIVELPLKSYPVQTWITAQQIGA